MATAKASRWARIRGSQRCTTCTVSVMPDPSYPVVVEPRDRRRDLGVLSLGEDRRSAGFPGSLTAAPRLRRPELRWRGGGRPRPGQRTAASGRVPGPATARRPDLCRDAADARPWYGLYAVLAITS